MKQRLRKYNPKSTYTDFGAAYIGRMGEIQPHWFIHSFGLMIGLFCFIIGFSGCDLFIMLGLMAIYGSVMGFKDDYKKRNWSLSDY